MQEKAGNEETLTDYLLNLMYKLIELSPVKVGGEKHPYPLPDK